jgi:hypothetical protein
VSRGGQIERRETGEAARATRTPLLSSSPPGERPAASLRCRGPFLGTITCREYLVLCILRGAGLPRAE